MIIDVHAHAFPYQGGACGYDDTKTNLMRQQDDIAISWGNRVSSTLDEKYIPLPGEDVNFKVGKYGRYYWIKHGKECWLQKCPTIMVEMEWAPEQMIAFMDVAGVDKAVLQAGYMEADYCRKYFVDCVKRWPNRFIGTVSIDYDIEKSEEYRQGELKKLRDSVHNDGMQGVFKGYPREQKVDDDRFDPFWAEMANLKIPHFFFIGFMPKQKNLESIERLTRVLKKFPGVNGIIGHLGGNVKQPSDPDYTDTPSELLNLLKLPNVYFEVGYVLAYENWAVWKQNYEYPYPLHTKLVKRIYDEVGAERLLFGADMPFTYRTCTYKQCVDLVRLHFDFLNEEEKSLVLGGNAAKLFRV